MCARRARSGSRDCSAPTHFTSPWTSCGGGLGELDKGKKIYVNCYSGLRSYLACRILSQHGFQCSNLSGGWRFWSYNATDRAHDAAPTHLCGVPTGKD